MGIYVNPGNELMQDALNSKAWASPSASKPRPSSPSPAAPTVSTTANPQFSRISQGGIWR